jgi:hypothetical protein
MVGVLFLRELTQRREKEKREKGEVDGGGLEGERGGR